jgi:fatty acid desaturase
VVPCLSSLLCACPLQPVSVRVSHSRHDRPRLSGPLSYADASSGCATLALFWFGKILHYGLLWALPLVLHGGVNGFFGAVLPTLLTGGLFLAISFSVSHNVPSTEYNTTTNKTTCFAETQIRTSADWAPDSLVSCFLWGGLNTQIVHHLFPGIAHIHYPALTRIVVDVCKEKGIPYNAYPTFADAVRAHFQHLHELGNSVEEDIYRGKIRSPRLEEGPTKKQD